MTIRTLEPDQSYKKDVIDRLEVLLKKAQTGEIISLVYACERPLGAVTFGSTRIKDRYLLLGYLAHMQHMTSQSLDNDATPSTLGDE